MVKIASCIIINEEGKLLLLKRSNKVGAYKGLWSGVAGHIEEGEEPIQTAYKEIKEEIGIDKNELILIKSHGPVKVLDKSEGKNYDWEIFIFLFKCEKKGKLNIDWEHSEYCWIPPFEIKNFNTVPKYEEIVLKLL